MKPFYIYAGEKTRLLKQYERILPEKITTYVEPFFGGGAVFAWLYNKKAFDRAIINDTNKELISVINAVKDDERFLKEVDSYIERYLALDTKEERKAFYYNLRKQYWENQSPALLFILMRLGFNGIWQTCEKSQGLYGTPAGLLNHQKHEQIYSPSNLKEWKQALKDVTISAVDYKEMDLDDLDESSVVYLDPPYRKSFATYGSSFDDKQQEELIQWALKLKEQTGAQIFLANRFTGDGFFENLLPQGNFHFFRCDVHRRKAEKGRIRVCSEKSKRIFS